MITKISLLSNHIFNFSINLLFYFLFKDIYLYFDETPEISFFNGIHLVSIILYCYLYFFYYTIVHTLYTFILSYIYFYVDEDEEFQDFENASIIYGRKISIILFKIRNIKSTFKNNSVFLIFFYFTYIFICYVISNGFSKKVLINPSIKSIVYIRLVFDVLSISFIIGYIVRYINENSEIRRYNDQQNQHNHPNLNNPNSTSSNISTNASTRNSLSIINSFFVHPLDIEDDFICPICLINNDEDTSVILLECEHKFHRRCIMEWVSINSNCPVCRHNLEVRRSVSNNNNNNIISMFNINRDNNDNIDNYLNEIRQREINARNERNIPRNNAGNNTNNQLQRNRPRALQIPIRNVYENSSNNSTPDYPNRVIS